MLHPALLLETLAARSRLHAHEHWSPARLRVHQREALSALRRHAYAHSAFYQEFHAGLETAPLEALPVLTKAMVMDRFDDLVTDPAIRLADVKAYVADHAPEERLPTWLRG